MASFAGGMPKAAGGKADDDDVPELVENFEDVSKGKAADPAKK